MTIRMSAAPASWGVETRYRGWLPNWETVLNEIEEAGYQGTELGPFGYLPTESTILASELRRRGLSLAAGTISQPLQDEARHNEILTVAREVCELVSGAGSKMVVVIARAAQERLASAGRPNVAPRLDRRSRDHLIAVVERIARVARDDFDLTTVMHPHAGGYVEFEDEIEDLLEGTDPGLVGLCIDTGHCTYARINPLQLYVRFADRTKHFHFKDLRSSVMSDAVRRGLSLFEAVDAGLCCALGDGMVDFPDLIRSLVDHSYDGWVVVEQDRPHPPYPDQLAFREAVQSRVYLRASIEALHRATEAAGAITSEGDLNAGAVESES